MDKGKKAFALMVTRNFPPLLGGMEKLNQYLLHSIELRWQPILFGPAGCAAYTSTPKEIKESRIKPMPIFLLRALWHSLRLAFRYDPTVVLGGSGLVAPIVWLVARCRGARAVVYLHGLDIATTHWVYRAIWLPAIRHCDVVVANSRHTEQLALDRGVLASRLRILNPGTEIPQLDSDASLAFRDKYRFGERPIMLSVGRLTARKGLAQFVARALPTIVAKFPNVLLVVIGDDAVNAVYTRGSSEKARIVNAARAAGVEDSICFLGSFDLGDVTAQARLSAAYLAANVHVFPVQQIPGDVEGFGMVALEAAAHGLPTVAFAVGGIVDAVDDGVTGELVVPADYPSFANAIVRQLELPRSDVTLEKCRTFAKNKSWPLFIQRFDDILGATDGGA